MYLGRYLGPAIYVGLSLTAKVFYSNGEVLHCSIYCSLLLEEFNDEKEVRLQLYAMVEDEFGTKAVTNDFGVMGL